MTQSDTHEDGTNRFKHYPMMGVCRCGSFETMYVGETFIDEKCCRCGIIIGGGYLAETDGGYPRSHDTETDQEDTDQEDT